MRRAGVGGRVVPLWQVFEHFGLAIFGGTRGGEEFIDVGSSIAIALI